MPDYQFLFFSGKGGVGKTSMSCATAVRLAAEGKRTLIVTTDPAPNLGDVFEQPIGHHVTPVAGVPNLWAMEIDPDRATQEYKERALAPVRMVFPTEVVQVVEEQLSGPCTAEVASFDRFVDFMDNPTVDGQPVDVVVFDTAPTGHTLRLLELPGEWTRSIEEAAAGSGQTCLGPVAVIEDQKAKYERALAYLRDPLKTRFVFVLHPEGTAVAETERAIEELNQLGIHNHELIINGIVPPTANPFFAERRRMQESYLKAIAEKLPYPARLMYLLDDEIKGADRLRRVARTLWGDGDAPIQADSAITAKPRAGQAGSSMPSRADRSVLERITPGDYPRTVFFAGKGGVGKTTVSCVTAVWLARQGFRTLLVTTDPAAHTGLVLDVPVESRPGPVDGVPNLWAARIDADQATLLYKERLLADARAEGRSPEALEAMAEELNSPCTEEMAVFEEFINYASFDEWDAVIFDTAPTGHTLRLLELPVDWSRQLEVKAFRSGETATQDLAARERFAKVIDMMRNPARSTLAFVMYPENTPVVEAYRAAKELATVGIPVGLVVANQVIPEDVCTTEYARARRAMQEKYLQEIPGRFDAPVLSVPLLPHEVSGVPALVALGERIFGPAVAVRR